MQITIYIRGSVVRPVLLIKHTVVLKYSVNSYTKFICWLKNGNILREFRQNRSITESTLSLKWLYGVKRQTDYPVPEFREWTTETL